jgi:YebC/PmpR family DNA-binding regulatory protein
MSGHSKWATIKRKKGAADAKRGQLFSKLVREIMLAVRTGGPGPETNTRLKSALERSREQGLPKDNIERAIAKAAGGIDTAKLQEFLYEAIGSGGVYLLIEGITDNNNRTLAEVRPILAKHHAKLVPPNSLLWNFEKVWTPEGKDYRPQNPLELNPAEKEKIIPLLDELVDHPDVQEVYTNLKES